VTAILLEDPSGGRRDLGGHRGPPSWARRLSGPVVLLVAWQLVVALHLVDDRYLTSPWSVVQAGQQLLGDGTLQGDLTASLSRVLWGLAFGVTAGVGLALVAGLFRLGEDLVDSTMNLLRAVPVIALLPLIILWLGIGETPKVVMIALGVFFPVVINAHAGVRGTDPLMVKAAKSLGAGSRQVILKVVLPSALPTILAGYRLGAGIALLLVVSAEMINATTGIGFLILNSGDLMLTGKLMVGLATLSLLGLASTWGLRALEAWLAPWKEEGRG